MFVLSGILSGCIAYDAPYRDEPTHRSDGGRDREYGDHHGDHDRDHDRDHDYERH